MRKSLIFLLACASALPFAVQAQEAGSAASALNDDRVLDEVVVTAQKREQNIQDIPTTISVVSGQKLDALDVANFGDLGSVVPGVIFRSSPGGNYALTIRGIGTSSGQQAFEQSVATYVDGIYGGFQKDLKPALFDLERVEVLKGTQSGILGKNTSVGAINVVTRKPGDVLGGYLTAQYEFENPGWSAEGAVDIPASETFKVRLAGRYSDDQGFGRNIITGNRIPQVEHFTARVNALWEPSSSFDANLVVQYDNRKRLGDSGSPTRDPGGAITALDSRYRPGLDDKFYKFGALGRDGEDYEDFESTRGSLTLNASLGDLELTSVTAASENKSEFLIDLDFFTLENYFYQPAKFWQISQEFRIASPSDRPFRYIVGAFYLKSDWDKTFSVINFNGAARLRADIPFQQATETFSPFVKVDFDLSDKVTATGSLRYVAEDKNVTIRSASNWPVTFTAFPLTKQSSTPNFFDYGGSLQYKPTPDASLYVSFNKGTKTAGFADVTGVVANNANFVAAEVARSYEVGAKLTLDDGAATLNLSLWQMDIQDYQQAFVVNGAFATSSQDLKTKGFEVQGAWEPIEDLTLSGSVVYTDAQNKSLGVRASVAPKWTGVADINYKMLLENTPFALRFLAHGYYMSPHFQDNPILLTSTRATLDLGLTLEHEKGWEIGLLSKNVTNAYDCETWLSPPAIPAAARACMVAAPRTISLFAKASF